MIRALLKARARASRQFHENPQVPIDVIAKVLQVDKETARETYLFSKRGFTQNGIVSERDAREYLKGDAERQKLKEPLRCRGYLILLCRKRSMENWEFVKMI